MEIVDLSWKEVTSRRSNHPLLLWSIRGIIVNRVPVKRHFCIIFYLDRDGSITITFAYLDKVFFNPNIEYLKKPLKKIC